jgi:hypothetical protein
MASTVGMNWVMLGILVYMRDDNMECKECNGTKVIVTDCHVTRTKQYDDCWGCVAEENYNDRIESLLKSYTKEQLAIILDEQLFMLDGIADKYGVEILQEFNHVCGEQE